MPSTSALKSVARTTAAHALLRANRLKIRADASKATPTGRRVLEVVHRCMADDFTSEDRDWFNRVENHRQAMLSDHRDITKVDFGAGARDQTLTEAEMAAGTVKITSVADVTRQTSKSPWWAQVLYALADEYKPQMALELGTSVGISASYQGGALQRFGGRLVTIEGAPEVADIARNALDAVGLSSTVDVLTGRFGDVLPGFLASVESLNYVFVDGHHDEQATQEYHRQISPHLAPGAVLVYDDIHWSPGMERAWGAICNDPALCVTVDLQAVGIAILGQDTKRAYRYTMRGV